jgi:sugar lactone lactonase YvrE
VGPAGAAEINQTLGRRITIAGDRLVLTEPDDNRVAVYDVSGPRPRKLGAFGAVGAGGGELYGPHGATLDPASGWVWVADTFNHRVQAFDVAGLEAGRRPRLVRLFGTFGREAGDLRAPGAPVLLSPHPRLKGRVFVVDSGNDRVQVFDAGGRPAGMILGGKGAEPGRLDGPVAAAFDRRGRVLYVAESVNRRISAFDAVTGAFLFAFGPEITSPGGLAVDGAGIVYATDVGARLVRRYAPRRSGELVRGVAAAGQWGSDDPAWRHPQSIAVDGRGRVYVVDRADDRGRIFSAAGAPLGTFGEDVEPAAPAEGGEPAPLALPATICGNGRTFQLKVLSAPSPIPLGALFDLEVGLREGCGAGGRPVEGATLRVEAVMPGHGHGMNTHPRSAPLGEGRFLVSGMRFHMPGEWEVHFDLIRDAVLERAQAMVAVD